MKRVRFILLFLSAMLSQAEAQVMTSVDSSINLYGGSRNVVRIKRRYTAFELSAGFVSLFTKNYRQYDANLQNYYQPGFSGGFMITRSGNYFSVLTGASFDYTILRQYDIYNESGIDFKTVYTGYRMRISWPVLFRWTHRLGPVNVFWQVGFAAGGAYYKGWGYAWEYSDHGGSAPGHTGWQRLGAFYTDPLIAGFGTQYYIRHGVELVASVNGSPGTVQFAPYSYQPSVQLSIGFRFHRERHK